MKRSAVRRAGGSPQPSSVASRSATWCATAPSGWPARGSPQARPVRRSGADRTATSRSVSGTKPGSSSATAAGSCSILASGVAILGFITRALLDALGYPVAFVRAGQNDARLCAIPAAHGHHVRSVLLHARPIVDEHQVQVVVFDVRPLRLEGLSRRLLEQRLVPALVLRASRLQRLVRAHDSLLE